MVGRDSSTAKARENGSKPDRKREAGYDGRDKASPSRTLSKERRGGGQEGGSAESAIVETVVTETREEIDAREARDARDARDAAEQMLLIARRQRGPLTAGEGASLRLWFQRQAAPVELPTMVC